MEDSSLWPDMARIMNWGKDSPYDILTKQSEYIKQINQTLIAKIEDAVDNTNLSLSSIDFDSRARYFNSTTLTGMASRLSIGRAGKVYSFELLRLRYNSPAPYPIEVYDSLGEKIFTIKTSYEFKNCLQRIFSSQACLEKLRYILWGKII